MGWSCSWIAVQGKPTAALLGELGLRPVGKYQTEPEAPWSGAALPNGWYLVFAARECEPHQFNDNALATLSNGCELIASAVEEHVMCCSAAYWRNGRREWSIVHDAQQGIYHLAAEGTLPASYSSIRDKYLAQQGVEGGTKADVDLVFEIPLAVGVELTSFRHDHDFPAGEPAPFEVLDAQGANEAPATKKSWWRVLKGRTRT